MPLDAADATPGASKKTKILSRVVITKYSDGFTLDLCDGQGESEVRRPDQPENAMFLQDLEKGMVPMELRAMTSGGQSQLLSFSPPLSALPHLLHAYGPSRPASIQGCSERQSDRQTASQADRQT